MNLRIGVYLCAASLAIILGFLAGIERPTPIVAAVVLITVFLLALLGLLYLLDYRSPTAPEEEKQRDDDDLRPT